MLLSKAIKTIRKRHENKFFTAYDIFDKNEIDMVFIKQIGLKN